MFVSLGFSGSTALPETLAGVDAAERFGLHGVWSAEHVGLNDAVVPSTVYASRSEKIEIGLMGLNPDTRSPGVLAMELATLNSVAAGRIRLHVGVGSPQRARSIGVTEKRTLAGVETFVDVMRRLLRGEAVTAGSEAFQLVDMKVATAIADLPAIPIDIMAIRPRMTALAARVADGLSLSVASSHEYLRNQVALAEEVLNAEGRDRSEFKISAAVLACIDDDLESARHRFATILAGFPLASTPMSYAGLELPDWGLLAETAQTKGPEAAGELFRPETLEGLGLVSTAANLSEAIQTYREDGIDELIVLLTAPPSQHAGLVEALARAGTR
jgi:alkanesulfonate monooxygenase SsuD/methylene tetrahydromethanopterin reductase-like flavin-dependent oxidoreductase (luciferase family)